MVVEVLKTPFEGRGKPEPLKYLPGNVWSRRITHEDRLVYRVYDDKVDFLQAKYQY
jgi:toxin YoeB